MLLPLLPLMLLEADFAGARDVALLNTVLALCVTVLLFVLLVPVLTVVLFVFETFVSATAATFESAERSHIPACRRQPRRSRSRSRSRSRRNCHRSCVLALLISARRRSARFPGSACAQRCAVNRVIVISQTEERGQQGKDVCVCVSSFGSINCIAPCWFFRSPHKQNGFIFQKYFARFFEHLF